MSSEPIIIKRRTRPKARIRDRSAEPELATVPVDSETQQSEDEEKNLPCVPFPHSPTQPNNIAHSRSLEDIIELRKLRRAREGIDVSKLNKGEPRKRKKAADDGSTTTPTGLIKGAKKDEEDVE